MAASASRALALLLLALPLAGVAWAQAGPSPLGDWRTIDESSGKPRAVVRIEVNNGVLEGRIERSLDPRDRADARKDQPMLGLTILTGLKPVPGDALQWDGGQILDPDSGTVYSARLKLKPGGKELEVRGFVGMALLGRTQTWQRVE
jgi:uncharacterized protein (DUF2147 family)